MNIWNSVKRVFSREQQAQPSASAAPSPAKESFFHRVGVYFGIVSASVKDHPDYNLVVQHPTLARNIYSTLSKATIGSRATNESRLSQADGISATGETTSQPTEATLSKTSRHVTVGEFFDYLRVTKGVLISENEKTRIFGLSSPLAYKVTETGDKTIKVKSLGDFLSLDLTSNGVANENSEIHLIQRAALEIIVQGKLPGADLDQLIAEADAFKQQKLETQQKLTETSYTIGQFMDYMQAKHGFVLNAEDQKQIISHLQNELILDSSDSIDSLKALPLSRLGGYFFPLGLAYIRKLTPESTLVLRPNAIGSDTLALVNTFSKEFDPKPLPTLSSVLRQMFRFDDLRLSVGNISLFAATSNYLKTLYPQVKPASTVGEGGEISAVTLTKALLQATYPEAYASKTISREQAKECFTEVQNVIENATNYTIKNTVKDAIEKAPPRPTSPAPSAPPAHLKKPFSFVERITPQPKSTLALRDVVREFIEQTTDRNKTRTAFSTVDNMVKLGEIMNALNANSTTAFEPDSKDSVVQAILKVMYPGAHKNFQKGTLTPDQGDGERITRFISEKLDEAAAKAAIPSRLSMGA